MANDEEPDELARPTIDEDPFNYSFFSPFAPAPPGLGDYEASWREAYGGDFKRLVGRLFDGQPLHWMERALLAGILSGNDSTFAVKRRDGRVGNRRYLDERLKIGAQVLSLVQQGHSEAYAFKTVAESFRSGGDLKSVRKAFREFKEYNGMADLEQGEPFEDIGALKDPDSR